MSGQLVKYPNPVRDHVRINRGSKIETTMYSYLVVSIKSRIVLSGA